MPDVLAELVAKITTDTSEFKKNLGEAGRDLENFAKENSKQLKIMGAAMLGASAAIVAGLTMSLKAAAAEEAGIRKLGVALRNVGIEYDNVKNSLEKWISTQQQKTAISDDAQRESLSTLILYTNNLAKAQDLLTLAMDISAGTGRDLSSVTSTLGYAIAGNWGMVNRMIPALAAVENEEQKWLLLRKMFAGQAEEYGKTLEGQFNRLTNNLNDLKEALGATLIEGIQPFVSGLADWVLKLKELNPEVLKFITYGSGLTAALFALGGAGLLAIGFLPNMINGFTALNGLLVSMGVNISILLPLIAALIVGIGMIAWGFYQLSVQEAAREKWTQALIKSLKGEREELARLVLAEAERIRAKEAVGKATEAEIKWMKENAGAIRDCEIWMKKLGDTSEQSAKKMEDAWSEAAQKLISEFEQLKMAWESLYVIVGGGIAGTPTWYRTRGQADFAAWLEEKAAWDVKVAEMELGYTEGTITQAQWDAFWKQYQGFIATQPDVEAFEKMAGLQAYQYGGIVPGRKGEPVPILAHGGEMFLGEGAYTENLFNPIINIYLDGREISTNIVSRITKDIALQGGFV